ncbi:MAG: bifunctional glutamate N-acetyltransferase/amino-acid acetyltransferase ArgJ [Desulfobacterales bacterium]|nr:bifunctional glutamate N-acetyltransferase/amino-acid acetyltransferase ArgJ [Desulfobacterales bacterium]
MKLHPQPVMPQGFQCASRNCGLKEKGTDLSVFFSSVPAAAAAVFTKNHFPGAPVILGREVILGRRLQAVVVNSKISNVGTGAAGVENARRMARATAEEFHIAPDTVLVSSTGVIAKPLPIEKIERGIQGISALIQDDPIVGAQGIMTTDTYAKAVSMNVGPAVLTLVGKGAGMIEPNMATMLVYVFTDAAVDADALDAALRDAVAVSFNMLSVDTDTSTSDTCAILANGLAGPVDQKAFSQALSFACIEMTQLLARDGEGATKLLTGRVSGARDAGQARQVAKSLINSPLIKTMAYGADPNIGRILMAVGKCFDCDIHPERIIVHINDRLIYARQERVDFDEAQVRTLLGGDRVDIAVDLGAGQGEAMAYGCDLTEGYIKENAAYYSS